MVFRYLHILRVTIPCEGIYIRSNHLQKSVDAKDKDDACLRILFIFNKRGGFGDDVRFNLHNPTGYLSRNYGDNVGGLYFFLVDLRYCQRGKIL